MRQSIAEIGRDTNQIGGASPREFVCGAEGCNSTSSDKYDGPLEQSPVLPSGSCFEWKDEKLENAAGQPGLPGPSKAAHAAAGAI